MKSLTVPVFLLTLFIPIMPGTSMADHLSDEKMVDVVWTALERSSFTGFSYPGAAGHALAACIDWEHSEPDDILINGWRWWYQSSGAGPMRECEARQAKYRNCTCQILDVGGVHKVKVPSWWRKKFSRH
ncbi:MAG: hypothetical protein ISR52_07405 [Rhodospirillales bacterium]|nr:hypothetical protein [Rhodospirillales bacterium]